MREKLGVGIAAVVVAAVAGFGFNALNSSHSSPTKVNAILHPGPTSSSSEDTTTTDGATTTESTDVVLTGASKSAHPSKGESSHHSHGDHSSKSHTKTTHPPKPERTTTSKVEDHRTTTVPPSPSTTETTRVHRTTTTE